MFIALVLENFNRWDSYKWKTTQRNLCLVKLSVSNEPLQSKRKCFVFFFFLCAYKKIIVY